MEQMSNIVRIVVNRLAIVGPAWIENGFRDVRTVDAELVLAQPAYVKQRLLYRLSQGNIVAEYRQRRRHVVEQCAVSLQCLTGARLVRLCRNPVGSPVALMQKT